MPRANSASSTVSLTAYQPLEGQRNKSTDRDTDRQTERHTRYTGRQGDRGRETETQRQRDSKDGETKRQRRQREHSPAFSAQPPQATTAACGTWNSGARNLQVQSTWHAIARTPTGTASRQNSQPLQAASTARQHQHTTATKSLQGHQII